MATKLDQNFVRIIREQHDNARGGFDTLVAEVERLEAQVERLENALLKYATAIDKIYNHNAAARAAVVQHFGTLHPQAPDA